MMNTNERNNENDDEEHEDEYYARDQTPPDVQTEMKAPEPYVQLEYRVGDPPSYHPQSWKMEYDVRRREEMVDIILRFLINSALRDDDLSLLDLTRVARDLETTHFREARTLDEYLSASKLKDRLLQLERTLKAERYQRRYEQRAAVASMMHHQQQRFDSPPNAGQRNYTTIPDLSPIPEYFPMFQEGTHSPVPDFEAVKRASLGSISLDLTYSPTKHANNEDVFQSEPDTDSPEYTRQVRFTGTGTQSPYYNTGENPESETQQQQRQSEWSYKQSAKDVPAAGQDTTTSASLPTKSGGKVHTGVPQDLRQKRKRLLLMWHSSQCDNDACNCATMKTLWKHLKACSDNKCKYPHCYSTRVLLTHWRKCTVTDCSLCTPVRKQILAIQSKTAMKGGSATDIK